MTTTKTTHPELPPTKVVRAELQWFCTACGEAANGTPTEYSQWRHDHICDPTVKALER